MREESGCRGERRINGKGRMMKGRNEEEDEVQERKRKCGYTYMSKKEGS